MKRGRRRIGVGSLKQTVTGDMVREWWVSFNLRVFFFFFFFKPKSIIIRNWLEYVEMAGTASNWSEFDPRWNGWYYGTGLHANTRYSNHFRQNKINNIGFYALLLYLFGYSLMEGQFSIYRLALINRWTNLLVSFKPHGREKVFYKGHLSQHTSPTCG